jgi:hypothetical protein
MTKRPSLKGKGADIFAPGESSPKATRSPRRRRTPVKPFAGTMVKHSTSEVQKPLIDKATFYLPADLLDRLDRSWMEQRRKNRKIRKSDIVKEALEAHLK